MSMNYYGIPVTTISREELQQYVNIDWVYTILETEDISLYDFAQEVEQSCKADVIFKDLQREFRLKTGATLDIVGCTDANTDEQSTYWSIENLYIRNPKVSVELFEQIEEEVFVEYS